jgi:putative PIN family toxin of toxin-antitoxin system
MPLARTGVRAVADTNTVVSGMLWQRAPHALLLAARIGTIALCTSDALLAELSEVLQRAKFAKRVAASGMTAEALVERYALLAKRIAPAEINPVVLADPDDDALIACAIAARADLIVSGDKRVRNLKHHQHIQIVSAAQALALIARRS